MKLWKVLQKQFYDILSNKCYLLLVLCLIYGSLISVLHFSEVWLSNNWTSRNKLNIYSITSNDNIGGKSFQDKLCQHTPIDVVYTWVNGSDPVFLNQLRMFERSLYKESSISCSYKDCLPSHFTAFKQNASKINQVLDRLSYVSMKPTKHKNRDWTVLRWDSVKSAEEHADSVNSPYQQNVVAFHVHWTTDESAPDVYYPGNSISIKGVLNKSLESLSKVMLDQALGQVIASVWRYPQVIFAELNSESDVQKLLKGKKWNVIFVKHLMKLNITRAGLLLELPSHYQPEDFSASRYEDKEELRYSLRSLEKYAPWVRKVFIVTNGQLPHWLDLSNPRVQIVTHQSIFLNSSHLPTFSSPGIETHIHRIPGLSEKFLYFNDDIFLGEEVLPEDFISTRGGQKVYLSWPVPDCSPVCPWTWVGDGTCDAPCNTSVCDFDGGDCVTSHPDSYQQLASHDDYTDADYQPDMPAKINHSLNFPVGYEEADKIKNKPILANTSFAINSDDDLNKLLDFLSSNGTIFTSNVVQEMFLLLEKLHLNNTLTNHGEKGLEEKSVKRINGITNKQSILLRKLGKNYNKFLKKKFENNESFHREVRRNTLSIDNPDHAKVSKNRSIEHLMNKSNNSIATRLILPNLSRSQVGIPPIGVAESLYAFQPELASLQRKLDTFAESLLHVNSLLNKRYGYKARKVPSHMPHLIDRDVITSLQSVYPEQYEKTSSRYFRHPQDMQFSFGYFYFLMNEEVDVPVPQIFDLFDTDQSGTWSDRELRTVLSRLYDLPLQRSSVLSLETALLFCARNFHYQQSISTPPYERYIDSRLPLVTKYLVENCTIVSDLLKRKMGKKKRYLYTVMKPATREAVVAFHMITSNLSHVLATLDKIRKKPKKFICLNDNLNSSREEDNQLIRAVLIDFFHSLFPKPSQFELPVDYRNRYLYYEDFVVWQSNRKKLSFITYTILIVTIVFIFYCLFNVEVHRMQHKIKVRLMRLVNRLKSTTRKLPKKL